MRIDKIKVSGVAKDLEEILIPALRELPSDSFVTKPKGNKPNEIKPENLKAYLDKNVVVIMPENMRAYGLKLPDGATDIIIKNNGELEFIYKSFKYNLKKGRKKPQYSSRNYGW